MNYNLNKFSAYLRRNRSAGTATTYSAATNRFIKWLDGREPTAEEVDIYLGLLLDEGRSSNYAKAVFYAIKAWFKFNQRSHELEYVEIPRAEITDPDYLTVEEVQKLIQTTSSKMYKAAFALQYGAGLRFTELAELNVDDRDENRGYMDWNGDGVLVVTLKHGGYRTKDYVSLDASIVEIVADYVADRIDDDPMLFRTRAGNRVKNDVYNRVLTTVCRRAGLKRITSHALRHSRGTGMAEDMADPLTISTHLRHSNIQSTMKYIHLTGQRIRERIPSAFRDNKEGTVENE